MLDITAVGKKIKEERMKRNISQDELALDLYVTRQAVSRWELGLALPSIDNLVTLTKMFQMSFEKLLCLDDDIILDEQNIFKGHDRNWIIKGILDNALNIDLPKVFYQFTQAERLLILKAVRNKKVNVEINELKQKLSTVELHYLRGGKIHEEHGSVFTISR